MLHSMSTFRFNEFDVDPHVVQLRRSGVSVHLEPRTFDLLLFLIERRERVVAKAELLETVWEGAFVTESALTRAVTRLRQALGDRADKPLYVETIRGRGYRFRAAIEIIPSVSTVTRDSLYEVEPAIAAHRTSAGPHNIASPSPDFTGRDGELDAIIGSTNKKPYAMIAGLRGMGGVGKTELARRVAQEQWSAFPDAHLEIDLAGASPKPLASATALAQLLHDLNPQAELPRNEAALARVYQNSLRGKRGIVLLDNAATSAQVEPLLPPHGWLTLITSRFRFAVPGLKTFDLDTMSADEARSFLAQLSPRSVDITNDLLRLTGQLPLALRLVGGALASHSDLEPPDYVGRLERATSLDHRLDASVSLSFELLGTVQQKRWLMLSVFPGSFTSAAAAALWETNEDSAKCGLSDFFVACMVESAKGRYRLHDVARQFARRRLADHSHPVSAMPPPPSKIRSSWTVVTPKAVLA